MLDEICNSRVLQRRRSRGLLRKELLAAMLLISIHTSVGGVLGSRAIRLTVLLDRLIEQDEVLLKVLLMQLLRGWCRQARGTGGKPC